MKLVRGKFVFVFIILAIVEIAALPSSGGAQQILKGEFKLTQEVHWGNSVLPVGDYEYYVDSNGWPVIVRVEEKSGGYLGLFVPQAFLRPGKEGPSGIGLQGSGDSVYVRSLHLPGLAGELDFSIPAKGPESRPDDPDAADKPEPPAPRGREYLTIINPNREKLSLDEVEKVYLSACEAVEREFNRAAAIRPRLVLRLGSTDGVLRYPMREIQLKKWDQYRFAEAVVDVALHDMVSMEDRIRLGNVAVQKAGATVNICELKSCAN